jgi:hypothetical protein
MLASDLFTDPTRRSYAAMPEMDALTEQDALLEAALVDVDVDVVQGAAGLLFDLRGAVSFQEGNTAVLIARGVSRLEWNRGDAGDRPGWWAVMESTPATRHRRFTFSLGFIPPRAGLVVDAAAAEFYVGDMQGRDDAPPDFTSAGPETIRAEMQRWDVEFLPKAAVFLDPFS